MASSSRLWIAGLLLPLGTSARLCGQTVEKTTIASPGTTAPRSAGLSTLLSGANATVTVSSVHDSSIGWYEVVTPTLSYSASPRFAVDASLSIFPYRLVQNQSARVAQLTASEGDTGDLLLAVHGSFFPRRLQNTTTASLTLPTGNQADGLGLGKATFDISNHSERYFGRKGLLLDVGLGDSSGLFNRLVRTEESPLAPIAHFQTGTITPLPFQAYLQTSAYEQLPLGDQKIYTVVQQRRGLAYSVVTGRKVSEDNGFANELTLPLTEHLVFSSFYTRSLRLHLDTVSVGLTYSWKSLGRRRDSMIDRALAEAERVPQ